MRQAAELRSAHVLSSALYVILQQIPGQAGVWHQAEKFGKRSAAFTADELASLSLNAGHCTQQGSIGDAGAVER